MRNGVFSKMEAANCKLPDAYSCCGCEACQEICPPNAIKMEEGKGGFLFPMIEQSKCIRCGACEKVCPIINKKKIQLPKHNIKCFAGYLKDAAELKSTASGGIATAFAKMVVKQGGVVYGVSYSDEYKNAEYIECRNENDLKMIRSSKYIQGAKKQLYSKIKQNIDNGINVLVFGLPCEIAAVKSYIGKDYKNLITCELICHGPTSQKIQKSFIELLEKRYHSTIQEFNVRYNEDTWSNPYVYAKFSNGKIYKKALYKTDFGFAFAHFIRPSCYHCHYKGENRAADITIGDFWGDIKSENWYNKDGVSAIMLHTDKGMRFINSVDNILLFEAQYERIKSGNPRLEEPEPETKKSKIFRERFEKYGLSLTCMLTRDLGDFINLLFGK